jgi:hypothetical protein
MQLPVWRFKSSHVRKIDGNYIRLQFGSLLMLRFMVIVDGCEIETVIKEVS